MSNTRLAADILRFLWSYGVRDVIVCAGARNAPFVNLLSQPTPFQVHAFFEERSAAFFALGKMQALDRPVAVITTSGTAAAELLPAAIEADYQGQPLILVTADRPRHFRGSGSPQTINQIGLYSHYVEKCCDVEDRWPGELQWSRRRPLHLNVCFSEPLLDEELPALEFPEASPRPALAEPAEIVTLPFHEPVVLVSGLPAETQPAVIAALLKWRRPVLLEGPSNLRGHPELSGLEIRGGDKTLSGLRYDGVIRIGSVPTLRFWRDMEESGLPVAHFSHLPFPGLARERRVFPLASLALATANFTPWAAAEMQADRARAGLDREQLRRFPLSEPAWMEWLSRAMPAHARVFLGNSLPIREWDLAAVQDGHFEIFANRGVNGIDGLISTFLGLASSEKSNWCILGDLSALYDLSGPWANILRPVQDVNLVIINNGGGKIFHRMFRNPLFENSHTLNFKAWAEMWSWDYLRLDQPVTLAGATRPRVIEIVPENGQTENFWRAREDEE